MKKLITALTAAFFAVTGALADVVTTDGVAMTTGKLASEDSINWTASELDYYAPASNDSLNRSETGWYVGIQRTWALSFTTTWIGKNYTGTQANRVKASFNDNTGRTISEFSVYKIGGDNDNSPVGKGIKNEFESYYIKTTDWNVCVTPEMLYDLEEQNYVATLTIGGNTYTITVPHDIVLRDGEGDGSHQWYPAVGLLGDKVYGEAQYLADQISVENYKTVKFLSEPVDVMFGDGFAASDNGDGTWGVTMTHSHAWTYSPDGATLTATCGNTGCPVGGATSVTLVLSGGNKTYDNTAITASADFASDFKTIFPDAKTTISIKKDGVPTETIQDAGTYTVTMAVTGLSDEQSRELSRTVTISKVVITDAMLSFTPANPTYTGAEQTVTPSVTANGLAATFEVDADRSTVSATERGTYYVTVNGTGNFEGTATAEWSIVNTTGSLKDTTPAVDGVGSIVNENTTNTLNIADSTALEYSDGAWYAGITLEWPVDSVTASLNPMQNGHAYYVRPDKMQLTVGEGVYSGNELVDVLVEYSEGVITADAIDKSYKYLTWSGILPELNDETFKYLATTTWKVRITPAIIEAAIAEEQASLMYTMNAGAFIWEDSDKPEGDSDGVAFADYVIKLQLDKPVVFALGEGKAYDLGDTVLTTTKIRLAAGASVTSSVPQTVEGAIYTEVTGYAIVPTESEGKYIYTAQLTHVHNWSASKAENGYELVAKCANSECDINGGEVKMWLDVGTTEKTYDGNSVTRKAEFGDGFLSVYPDAAAVLTVNKKENGAINNAGDYEVVLTVTGVGEGTYTLSRKVKISKADISEAELVLTPATTTYNGNEQTVKPSVTVNGATATLENNGLEVSAGTCTAEEMGTYPVTVNGTGNFTGAASAQWSIVNTTGEPTSVAASADGSMTNVGNDFTLSDSSKLEYDAENEVWYAGITITWPMEKKTALGATYDVDYIKEDMVKVTTEYGVVANVTEDYTYLLVNTITYVSNTTWKVGITPAIITDAINEEKTALTYTMRAGAIKSDTYEKGVEFQNYTITISIDDNLKLYDGDGKQVYPKAEGQTIIEDIKDEIDTEVTEEVAESAKGKIDDLVNNVVAGESPEQDVADWVSEMKNGYDTPADFYTALAESDYVEASFKLGTDELITEESEVEVAEFEETEDGFAFAVTIDGDDIEAARVKAAEIIKTSTDLKSFSALDKDRVEVSGDGKMTVKKGSETSCEFFMVEIQKDKVE